MNLHLYIVIVLLCFSCGGANRYDDTFIDLIKSVSSTDSSLQTIKLSDVIEENWDKVYLVYRGGEGSEIPNVLLQKGEIIPVSGDVCHHLYFSNSNDELVYSFDYNLHIYFHGFSKLDNTNVYFLNKEDAIFYVKQEIDIAGNVHYNLFQKAFYESKKE